MSNECSFDVEAILANEVVVGRNHYVDIPVGSVFTSLKKSRLEGEAPNFQTVEMGVLTKVSLRLDKVEWYRQSIDAIPRGHTAGLHLSGDGWLALAEALKGRQKRETARLCALLETSTAPQRTPPNN